MKTQYFYPLINIFGCLVKRLKVTKHLIFSSSCLGAMPARWLLWASKVKWAQKLVTLASTVLLLQLMEILPTQGICKAATLATSLLTNLPIMQYRLYQPGGGYWAHGNLFRNRPRSWGAEVYLSLLPENLWYI